MTTQITSPAGTLPAYDRVAAVQSYLRSLDARVLNSYLEEFTRGYTTNVTARVAGYFGTFIGIEVTVRDAVQNIVLDVTHNKAAAYAPLARELTNLAHERGAHVTVTSEPTLAARVSLYFRDRQGAIIEVIEFDFLTRDGFRLVHGIARGFGQRADQTRAQGYDV
jgi:hypothetical protein